MILIERTEQRDDRKGRHIIALFGVGLIGRAVLAPLRKMGADQIAELAFSWNSEHRQARELEAIQQHILAPDGQMALPISGIDIFWAAGQSGFGSPEEHVISEVQTFERVLAFGYRLLSHAADARHSFHLISSAGGLFEGQRHVDRTSLPRPLRPYSRAKLQQERLLLGTPAQIRKLVYRVSSVYGFSGKGTRLGLVNTLIQNAIRRQSSNIFGNALTIRDYVLVSDIGNFVAHQMLDADLDSHTFVLSSGKPTTIFEMLNRVEKVVGRKLLHTFDNVRTNASDISFSPTILPRSWYPTDLDTGLRQTARFFAATAPSYRAY